MAEVLLSSFAIIFRVSSFGGESPGWFVSWVFSFPVIQMFQSFGPL